MLSSVTFEEGVVQLVKGAHLLNKHESLGVGDDLGSVESLLEVVNKLLTVSLEVRLGSLEHLAGSDTLVLERAETSAEHGFSDQSDRHAEIESVDSSPLAGSLLTGSIKDLLEQGGAIVVIVAEDVTGDFNQEGVQYALVPFLEDITNLSWGHTQTSLHDIVRLWQLASGLDMKVGKDVKSGILR